MEALTLDFTQAQARGHQAMTRAAHKAGDPWQTDALAWLHDFLRKHCELLPDDARNHGCPPPPSGNWRAFGAVVKHAKTRGWIEESGVARRASGNCAWAPKYRSLLFGSVR